MRAVWSFWSEPFRAHHARVWLSPTHHLLAWVLSVETAKRHYSTTSLVTDTRGAELLVGQLGLRFTTVSTELDALRGADTDWWTLGKLWTYRSQTEPFVHLDSDVVLWARLPAWLEQGDVFAQNIERFSFADESWYRPATVAARIRAAGGWAPDEWWWSIAHALDQAVCCGIVGGSATAFLSYYADLAIRMILHPPNGRAWAQLSDRIGDNILIEQYFLNACLAFHRAQSDSPHHALDVRYLFDSIDQAFDESHAARLGFTHLIGGAKANASLMDRLAARVQRDYPAFYERCTTVKSA
jgi:hypothetical protein